MNLRCMTPNYERIYAPWLTNPGVLLDLAKYKPGELLLDLAGGSGAISKEAILRGASINAAHPTVHLLDPNPNRGYMTPVLCRKTGYAENVEDHYPEEMFDIIVCRQAVGYINMKDAIPSIHKVLKIGGQFVFNSFDKPSYIGLSTKTFIEEYHSSGNERIEAVRDYTLEVLKFIEFHIRLFGHIFHIQIRRTYPDGIDFSWFKYWRVKELQKLLEPWFKVEHQQKGKSVHWVCTKENK